MSIIRQASADDLNALADPIAELPLMQRYGHNAGKLARMWRDGLGRGDRILVSYDRQNPTGVAWFMPAGTLGLGGYLRLIAVTSPAQRGGVGVELLSAFERETFAQSGHAFLLVSDFNTPAQRFYERHGYRRVGEIPALVVAGITELLYWKRRPTGG